jgi:hypothetical protein
MIRRLFLVLSACISFACAQIPQANDPFLDDLAHRTFRWFWETPLTPDRWPNRTFSSVAAVGFGLTSYGIGVERGYVPRDSAADRVLHTLRLLYTLPQGADATGTAGHKGFYYHFVREDSGLRFDQHVELSTIDTGLLLAGVLFCQSYFDADTPTDRAIRAYADSMYRRVDWTWFQQDSPTLLNMSWTPERGFSRSLWQGYNEAMILYILAIGSPTHPITPDAWKKWTETYAYLEYFGSTFVSFGPLFGHQYSHCWIDFRGIQDPFMHSRGHDYFENSRRATYSHQAYARENPRKYHDYSEFIWGLTACDGPGYGTLTIDGMQRRFEGYAARGASADWTNDDGTIAPTAAGGSIMFTPEISLPALKALKQRYGNKLYCEYGFVDAFNPTYVTVATPDGWFDPDYLGIDQGPILIAIENHRSEMVWKTMRKNPYIQSGLRRAGFTGGWLDEVK